MRGAGWALAGLGAAWAAAAWAAQDAPPTPVLVELFSSQGCSSCPSAEALMEELERTQPVAGREIIPIVLHVDYWDHLGWRDPFARPGFSRRQGDYERRLGLDTLYTPQAVVDGAQEAVGNRREAVLERVREAPRLPALRLSLEPGRLRLDGLQAGQRLYLAWVARRRRQAIGAGENRGRRLDNAWVVLDWRELEAGGPSRWVDLPAAAPGDPGPDEVVAFQCDGEGRVTGLARRPLPPGAP